MWHLRLGHPAPLIMSKISRQFNNLFPITSHCFFFCHSCPLGKSYRLFAPQSFTISSEPLELVFLDVWGPTVLNP